MKEDLTALASIAVGALIAGFFGYLGWDAARSLIPVLIPLVQGLGR